MGTLDLAQLNQIVQNAAAIRYKARLQPAGGAGDKVFPPTYEGGQYALETRVIDGQRLPCVHLDSVQSQANRMELALLEETRRDSGFKIPYARVDFGKVGLPEVGVITSLEAPHRLADAILRDSHLGTAKFRDSDEGKILDSSSLQNATGLFGLSPTSLLFGLWDSTGPKGGLGVKFQRALVSEIVGVDVETGAKSASRVDPLGIQKDAAVIYKAKDGGWTLEASEAKQEKGKALRWGKEGKPSEINHGNVTPNLDGHGGVTFSYALQTTVLSLPALRRLRFPLPDGKFADSQAQRVLAVLGLCASTLAIAKGCDLRSRCLLVPEKAGAWEVIGADGQTEDFLLAASDVCALLKTAVAEAKKAGLPWREDPLDLVPSKGLADLVRKSRELAANITAEE